MTLCITSIRFIALIVTTILPTAIFANEAIENVLGGPYTTCTGAVAWTENDNGATRVEPMRLAVQDADDAAYLALFLSEEDFAADNVWACMDGVCAAHTTVRAATTTNVLRLRHEVDLVGGEAVYEMEAVFIVVNARETAIQVDGTRGDGSFICEKALPERLLSIGQQ